MAEFPPVAIVILTYDRMDNAAPTLRGALDNLRYPIPFQVHIADDGSPQSYRDTLHQIAGGYPDSVVRSITVSNAERLGYGKSYNLSSQAVHDYNYAVLVLEDDWLLDRDLDLAPLVLTLQSGLARCIRLGYLSVTNRLMGEVVDSPCGKLLSLDPSSPDQYVWTGGARLETVSFQQSVGDWPEGISPGQVELAVCGRPEARAGVAWPMDLAHPTAGLFLHTGSNSMNAVMPEKVEVAG